MVDLGERQTLVVIGNGMTSHALCRRLAECGVTRGELEVVVFGEEPRPAYDRVHLTDLLGGKTEADLSLAPRSWYEDRAITLHLGDPVVEIDRDECLVRSASGATVLFDRLVFATGSRPFIPPIPGVDLPGVFVYRTVTDLHAILAHASSAKRAAVIGGGLLGLEAARAVHALGLEVHIIEAHPGLMSRQLDATGARLLGERVETLGVRVKTGARTARIDAGKSASAASKRILRFEDGSTLEVDLVIFAAGVRPRTELGVACGLLTAPSGGLLVDDRLTTSDPRIFAVGECATHRGITYGLAAPGYQMVDVLVNNIGGGDATFTGASQSTRLKLLGVHVASLGRPDEKSTPGATTHTYLAGGAYRKLVIADGHIIGAIAIGEWEDLVRIEDALAEPRRVSFWDLRRFRSTGSLFLKSESPPVHEWPAEALVCGCLGVRRGALSDAEIKGCSTVEAMSAHTGAGTMCGSCKPLLADYLRRERADSLPASQLLRLAPPRVPTFDGVAPSSKARPASAAPLPSKPTPAPIPAAPTPPSTAGVAAPKGRKSSNAPSRKARHNSGAPSRQAKALSNIPPRRTTAPSQAPLPAPKDKTLSVAPLPKAKTSSAPPSTARSEPTAAPRNAPSHAASPASVAKPPAVAAPRDAEPLSVAPPSTARSEPAASSNKARPVAPPAPRIETAVARREAKPDSVTPPSTARPGAPLCSARRDSAAPPSTARPGSAAPRCASSNELVEQRCSLRADSIVPPCAAHVDEVNQPRSTPAASDDRGEDSPPTLRCNDEGNGAVIEPAAPEAPTSDDEDPLSIPALAPPQAAEPAKPPAPSPPPPPDSTPGEGPLSVRSPRAGRVRPRRRQAFDTLQSTPPIGAVTAREAASIRLDAPSKRTLTAALPSIAAHLSAARAERAPISVAPASTISTRQESSTRLRPSIAEQGPVSEAQRAKAPSIVPPPKPPSLVPPPKPPSIVPPPKPPSIIPPPLSVRGPDSNARGVDSAPPSTRRGSMPPLRPLSVPPGRLPSIPPPRLSLAPMAPAQRAEERRRQALLGSAASAFAGVLMLLLAPSLGPARSFLGFHLDALIVDRIVRQASGYAVLVLSLLGLFLSIRKRVPRLASRDIPGARAFHGVVGAAAIAFLFLHTGLHLGVRLNRLLMLDFLALSALGAVAGLFAAVIGNGDPAAAQARRLFVFRVHVILFLPFPILVALHVLGAYYF
ncbi:Nitrite reductase [NAD(P)H] large subunit protein [Minicystis rosea]|nr:Nitrite reductase [NAD(P)H] large subunit protein [Minicystis rosea]